MAVFVAMTTYATTREAPAPGSPSAFQAHFEQLWKASEAAPLRGYENVLVAMLAAADRRLYAELTSVDFSDPVSVEAGVEATRQWRLGFERRQLSTAMELARRSAVARH